MGVFGHYAPWSGTENLKSTAEMSEGGGNADGPSIFPLT